MPRGVQTLEQQECLKHTGKMPPLNRTGEPVSGRPRLPVSGRIFSPESSPTTPGTPASIHSSGDGYENGLIIKCGHDGLLDAVRELSAGSPSIPVRSNKWSPSQSSASPRGGEVGTAARSIGGIQPTDFQRGKARADERAAWKRKINLSNTNQTDSRHPRAILHATPARTSLESSFNKQNRSLEDRINNGSVSSAAWKSSVPDRCYPGKRTDFTGDKDTVDENGLLADDDDSKPLLSSLKPGIESQPPHLLGFLNQGNTCYLNASLQALLGLPMLVTDAINARCILRQLEFKSEELMLSRAFFQLAALREKKSGLQKSERQRVTKALENLKGQLEAANPRFLGNRMQDANEFLCFLMDSISTETEKLIVELNKEQPVSLPNLVSNNFSYVREEVSRCLGCGHTTTSRQPDTEMWCTVPSPTLPEKEEEQQLQVVPELGETGTKSTQDSGVSSGGGGGGGSDGSLATAAPFAATSLSRGQSCCPPIGLDTLVRNNFKDEERERRCELCKHEKAQTKIQLVKLPKVLVLHLKRYDSQSRKISRPVHIPEQLNLGPVSVAGVMLPDSQPSTRLESAPEPPTPVKEPPLASPGGLRRCRSLEDLLEGISPLTTPVKSPPLVGAATTPGTPWREACRTPGKFRGKSDAEITEMSEEDQVEYLTHVSRKEMMVANNRTSSSNHNSSSKDGDDKLLVSPIISRKRSHSTDSPIKERKQLRLDESNSHTTTTSILISSPRTIGEEEEDLKKALELSRREFDFSQLEEEREQPPPPPPESELPTLTVGERPGLNYKLVSIVSHFGSSSNAGHYVADVFRFEQKKWFRYDDTVVTETLENFVRTSKNGYIMMYVWEGLVSKYLDSEPHRSSSPLSESLLTP